MTLAAITLDPCETVQHDRYEGETLTPDALGVDVAPRLTTLRVAEPAKRVAGVKVADVGELVAKLKNEAKVI